MPIGKKIYEVLSNKYSETKEEKRKRVEDKKRNKDGKVEVPIPATTNNYKTNLPRVARSLNFHPTNQTKRLVSETEGKPVVNASTDVSKLVHKPAPAAKSPLDMAGAGAIKPKEEKKKRGRPAKK